MLHDNTQNTMYISTRSRIKRTHVSDIPSFRRNTGKNFPTKAIANHGGATV